MPKYERFTRDVGLVALSTLAVSVQAVLLVPLLTKFMCARDYGVWSQIRVTIGLASPLALFGIGNALVRLLPGEEKRDVINSTISSTLGFALLSGTAFGFCMFLAADWVAQLITGSCAFGVHFRLASVLVAVRCVAKLLESLQSSFGRFGTLSTMRILQALASIAAVYCLLMEGWGLAGAITAVILVEVVVVICSFAFTKHLFRFSSPSWRSLAPVLSYGLPLSVSPLLLWTFQMGDQYILGYFDGAQVVGVYAVAYTLAFLPKVLVMPVITVLSPSLASANNKGDNAAFRKYFEYSYRCILIVVTPICAGLMLLGKPVVLFLATKEYLGAADLLYILVPGLLAYTLVQLAKELLRIENRTGTIRNLMVTMACGNVALNLVLIPRFSMIGAAVATLFTYAVAAAYAFLVIRKSGMDLMLGMIGRVLFSTLVMSSLVWWVWGAQRWPTEMRIAAAISVGAIAYVGTALAVGVVTRRELLFLKRLFLQRS